MHSSKKYPFYLKLFKKGTFKWNIKILGEHESILLQQYLNYIQISP